VGSPVAGTAAIRRPTHPKPLPLGRGFWRLPPQLRTLIQNAMIPLIGGHMAGETDSTYDQFNPPKALPFVGTFLGIAAFVGTASFTDNSAPFFAALSVGVISLIIGLTWPLRHRWLLWACVAAVTLAHVAALFLLRLPMKVSYGMLFAPLMGVEVLVVWRAIVWVLKKTGEPNGS